MKEEIKKYKKQNSIIIHKINRLLNSKLCNSCRNLYYFSCSNNFFISFQKIVKNKLKNNLKSSKLKYNKNNNNIVKSEYKNQRFEILKNKSIEKIKRTRKRSLSEE